MFSFANPEFLYLLILVPLVAGLYFLERLSRKRNLDAFGKQEQVTQLMPDASTRKHLVRIIIILLLLTTVIIMLARPRAGAAKKSTGNVKGIEVVIAMDVSNSMDASSTSDPQGMSRIRRAKMIMEKLIDRLRNDKVALVVFAGKAYMQMPMTIDGQSAKIFLDGIKTSMVPTQGTAIGSAIDLSMMAFSHDSKAGKAIILITDGENFEDDASGAAKKARKNDIQVNVIGVGTKEGAPIPSGDGGFMTDDEGKTIITCLNEDGAKEIANAGKGIYVNGDATDAVDVLDETLQKHGTSNLAQATFTKNDEQFPVFAWIALFLLIANVILLNNKNPWLAKHDFFKLKAKKQDE
ncbi:MAG: VWA domain-containing protein [Muribaculaceae bacterium]|nr:VWA domain-containing protein [Muribaculaceae bacterium]